MNTRARRTAAAICVVVVAAVAGLTWIGIPSMEEPSGAPPIAIGPAQGSSSEITIDPTPLEDGGLASAGRFMPAIHNSESLQELREVIDPRARLGIAVLGAEANDVRLGPRSPREEVSRAGKLFHQLGLLNLYEGRFTDAAGCFRRAFQVGRPGELRPEVRAERMALAGIAELRAADEGIHQESLDSTAPIEREPVESQRAKLNEAVAQFNASLALRPGDLRVRWLLNVAHRMLGEHPDKLAPAYLISLDAARSTLNLGRFENVAASAGLLARGPSLCGGAVFDDLSGDGIPDLFATAADSRSGPALFVNRGDGTFEDRTAAAGLDDQVYASNVARADFDNDGDLDLLLVRGGWEVPLRLSLLKNRGDARFDDVTLASGLGEPIASASACWADFDGDGLADLFVCGEYARVAGASANPPADPRNRCRLYRNRGDGTFVDVAALAGVANERCAQGAAWGDYDGDGRPDLFIANCREPSRLYHNEGSGTFCDLAATLHVDVAEAGPACWFWDYDNDGKLDLFVSANPDRIADAAAASLGMQPGHGSHPRLYRNLGPHGFRDVTHEVGLDRAIAASGGSFADIDNDGYLDLYLANASRSYSGLIPNRMFKNVGGERFEDVTTSSGTGGLQKGHGAAFADYDQDGDLDLFVETGGTVPGDRSPDSLYRNPVSGRRWLAVKLTGTKTNRAALGARIRVDVELADGPVRSIHRVVGSTTSVGTGSLVESFGLGEATRVARITIDWPVSRTSQTFRDLAVDRAIEVTEGVDSYRVIAKRPRR